MESRHCGQVKRIFFCPVHNASTPRSLQAFEIRCIHLIQKRLSYELLHCALLHTQTAMQHGCNEFVHCCMTRPQSMLLSLSGYLQCYLKIRYIHGALRSGYAKMRHAHRNNSEDNLF